MTRDLLELANECSQSQVDARALRDKIAPHFQTTLKQISDTIEQSSHALRDAHAELDRLRAELAGKRTSPEVSTQMECPDCHAVTRWGRHLDLDCDTIARLRNLIEDAPHTTSCSIWGDMIDTRTGKRPPIECDCWKRAALEGK